MEYYYVRNWRRFQHYKHRNPPWVKLHQEIFTSADWVTLADASKLLAVVCMVVAGKHEGRVPNDPAYIKRVAYLDSKPNLTPLIECGFLVKTLADASDCKQVRTNADPENRVQRTETESSKLNGHKVGKEGKSRKTKPTHGKRTKDGKRLWLDFGTMEWNQYAENYREAHSGVSPPLQWNSAGTWFNLAGEQQH